MTPTRFPIVILVAHVRYLSRLRTCLDHRQTVHLSDGQLLKAIQSTGTVHWRQTGLTMLPRHGLGTLPGDLAYNMLQRRSLHLASQVMMMSSYRQIRCWARRVQVLSVLSEPGLSPRIGKLHQSSTLLHQPSRQCSVSPPTKTKIGPRARSAVLTAPPLIQRILKSLHHPNPANPEILILSTLKTAWPNPQRVWIIFQAIRPQT